MCVCVCVCVYVLYMHDIVGFACHAVDVTHLNFTWSGYDDLYVCMYVYASPMLHQQLLCHTQVHTREHAYRNTQKQTYTNTHTHTHEWRVCTRNTLIHVPTAAPKRAYACHERHTKPCMKHTAHTNACAHTRNTNEVRTIIHAQDTVRHATAATRMSHKRAHTHAHQWTTRYVYIDIHTSIHAYIVHTCMHTHTCTSMNYSPMLQ